MAAETDAEFVADMEWLHSHDREAALPPEKLTRLFALARRGAAVENLGQVEQLSEELERVKREAERAQDAHGVRFLNYLEETARLSDEIERLRAALREIAKGSIPRPVAKRYRTDGTPSKNDQCDHGQWMYEECGQCIEQFARAALGEKP